MSTTRPEATTEPAYGSVDRYADLMRGCMFEDVDAYVVAFGMIDALTDYPTTAEDRLARIRNVVAATKRISTELRTHLAETPSHG